MKKKTFSVLSVALALMTITFSAAGCNNTQRSSAWIEKREEEVKSPTISFSETHKELLIGDETYLTEKTKRGIRLPIVRTMRRSQRLRKTVSLRQ